MFSEGERSGQNASKRDQAESAAAGGSTPTMQMHAVPLHREYQPMTPDHSLSPALGGHDRPGQVTGREPGLGTPYAEYQRQRREALEECVTDKIEQNRIDLLSILSSTTVITVEFAVEFIKAARATRGQNRALKALLE